MGVLLRLSARIGFGCGKARSARRGGRARSRIRPSAERKLSAKAARFLLSKPSAGHARALLQVEDGIKRFAVASRAVRKGMTVRQVERLAARLAGPGKGKRIPRHTLIDPNTREALEELGRYLGTRIGIRPRTPGKPGALLIEFYDEAQLAGIYDKILN